MNPLTRRMVFFLAVLAGCKGELTGVTVNLAADGSGDCQVIGIRDVQHLTGDKGDPGGVMQGVSEAQVVDLGVRQSIAKFASIKDLNLGGVTFALEKREASNLLTVHIPATAAAKWFAAFGVSEPTLALWNKLGDEAKRRDETRRKADPKAQDSAFPAPQPPNVAFTVNLPGRLDGHVVEASPLGFTTKISAERGERSASLSIPISDIHGGKLKEVVWKISYAAE